MRKWGVRTALALLLVAAVVLIGLMVWEPLAAHPAKAPPERAYKAEIVRDEWGVPHIYGHTDADVAYGVAIGTLLMQGLSLPWVIRALGLGSGEDAAHDASQAAISGRSQRRERPRPRSMTGRGISR